MSARDQILADVRRALAGAKPPAEIPRSYRSATTPASADLFAERVADYRAVVVRCAIDAVEATIAAALPTGAQVVVPAGVPWAVPGAVLDTDLSASALDELDAVVTAATLGIAETGTIVLTHGAGEGRRAISLVPDLHVCVVLESQVVAGVEHAVSALPGTGVSTWISGPSATSDIELERVEGVHGPRRLHVVLVAD